MYVLQYSCLKLGKKFLFLDFSVNKRKLVFFLIEVSELYPKAACVENEIHFSKHILDLVILRKGTCPAFVICGIFFFLRQKLSHFLQQP